MRRTLPLITALLLACDPPTPPAPAEPGDFDHPQALRFVDGLLVVANSGYRPDGPASWAPGSLTVLDPRTGAVHNRLPTSAPNPQSLRLHGGALYVVDTGPLDLSGAPQAAEPGAIDVFDAATLATAEGPLRSLPMAPHADDPRLGAPIDIALDGPRAVVTSATADALWVLDAARGAWLRGPADPVLLGDAVRLGLGAVRPWAGGFALLDFNADRLHLLDAAGTPTGCAIELGEHADAFEGAGSPVIDGDTLYALLVHAGRVRAVDLADLADDCEAPVRTVVEGLGQAPNHLALHAGRLVVVASGDNAVMAYDPASGAEVERWLLPVGSNPFHVAFDPTGRWMAVSEWAAHGVSLFDLDTGEHRRIGGETLPPLEPPPSDPGAIGGDPAPADVVVEAPGAGDGPFGDPERAVNGVRGGGGAAGGQDVFSLGFDDHLVLRWSGRRVLDGPGVDFVVFENPFRHPGGVFFDPLIVELSIDGETWVTWPHRYVGDGGADDPAAWLGFAGLAPVWLHAEDNPVHPFDPAAGGDGFDLAALPDTGEAGRIRREGFVFLRLLPAGGRPDPQTGAPLPIDPISDGPDVDGVFARWFESAP